MTTGVAPGAASPPAFPPLPHPLSRGPRPNLSVILPSLPRTPLALENHPPPPEARSAGGLGVTTAAALSGPQTRPWRMSIRRCQSYQLPPSSQSSLLQLRLQASCRYEKFVSAISSLCFSFFKFSVNKKCIFFLRKNTTPWTTTDLPVLEA